MPKSPKVRKESNKRERERVGRLKKTRTYSERVPEREEGNKSKEMDKEMKTMIREIREDTGE
jgi:hypothetical protein